MGGIRGPPEPPRPSIVRMELETKGLGVCETIWINWKRHYISLSVGLRFAGFFMFPRVPYRFDGSGKEQK